MKLPPALLRSCLEIAFPGVRARRLSILIFHQVVAEHDPLRRYEPTIPEFDALMASVAASFNVLPLAEAVARLDADSLPPRALSITFDDGYLDNLQNAVPVLRKHGLCATFFVATGYCAGARLMWNDTIIEVIRRTRDPDLDLTPFGLGRMPCTGLEERRVLLQVLIPKIKYMDYEQREQAVARLAERLDGSDPLPQSLMMTPEQIRELRDAGMQVGAHTVNHPILATLDLDGARREIGDSKAELEALLDEPVELFAYPNGAPGKDYGRTIRDLVPELGFKGAVSTANGVSAHGDDLYQLPRFTPWQKDQTKFLASLLLMRRNHYQPSV